MWKPTGVSLNSLAPGGKIGVDLADRTLLLVRLGATVHALDGICTHEGGILANGELHGLRIICPEHQANFDVTSGTVLADPDGIEPPTGTIGPLTRYPTRAVGGMVEVDLP